MADGSFTDGVALALKAAVEDGMQKRLWLNTLRHVVAAVGKSYGVFVTGTDRIDGVIYVTYDGDNVISVPETESYRRAESISTW